MSHLIYKTESFKIIGLCMEVHRTLGKGFSEIVYKDALEYEFKANKIPFEREREFVVNYKDVVLQHKFYADFYVWDKIILEVKSVKELNNVHVEQTINYLAVSNSKLGLLVNFSDDQLISKRLVRSLNSLPLIKRNSLMVISYNLSNFMAKNKPLIKRMACAAILANWFDTMNQFDSY